jgi:hypothetical protein
MEKTRKLSSDSEELYAWGNELFTVGWVAEVNGPEAVEVSGFIPTKHELKEIVKYWHLRRLYNRFFYWFHYGQSGSTEWRISIYAQRRIARVEELLSEKDVEEAVSDAEGDFKDRYRISDEDWNIYKNGSEEEWDAHRAQCLDRLK